MFWMLYDFFQVIPWCLNFIYQRFVTLIPTCLQRWNRQSVPKCWHIRFRLWGITQKKAYILLFVCCFDPDVPNSYGCVCACVCMWKWTVWRTSCLEERMFHIAYILHIFTVTPISVVSSGILNGFLTVESIFFMSYFNGIQHNLVYVNNCPTRCNYIQFIYICKLLYIFQVVFQSIIRSSYHWTAVPSQPH
jgi:hypothetical protein